MRRTLLGFVAAAVLLAGTALTAVGTASAATAARTAPSAQAAQAARAAPHARSWPLTWPVVKFGDKGNRVFAIQYLLRQVGYSVGPSGVFGGITRHDVAHFQRVRGLPGTGIVGSLTWPRLIVTVGFGSRGNAVAGVQQNLHFGYRYKGLPVTGFFGHITRGAVLSFQRRFHIGVDGVVGPVTWNTIIRNEK